MERELVWIPKNLIETVKNLEEVADVEEIKQIFKNFASEIEANSDDIEDAVSMFRRQSRKIKDALKEVVDKEVEELQLFWEEQEEKRSEIQKKISFTSDQIRATKQDILSLKESISSLNLYGIDKLIDMVTTINRMSEEDKELLSRLFGHRDKTS